METAGVVITIVVIVALLIFGFLIQSIRRKKNQKKREKEFEQNHANRADYSKNQSQNSSTYDQHLRDQFSAKRKIWFANIHHQVEIPELNYQEFIQIFPFFSSLEATKRYLENQNLSSEKIQETMIFLEKAQAKFNKVCLGADDRLLGQFQNMVSYLDANAIEFFSKYYLEFLNFNAYSLVSFWYEEVLVHTINLAINNQSLDYNYLRAGLKGYEKSLNNSIIQLVQRMRSDLYQQNRTSYEEFINEFLNQFFHQSSSHNRAKFNSGGYNGYQDEQSEYFAHQDEVALNAAYKELGVELDASDEQVKSAYRQLAKTYHPDKNPSVQAREKMSQINAAYSLIKEQRDIK